MPRAATSPIRCPYFHQHGGEPCQVIAALPEGLPPGANAQLKLQYCASGLFYGCPLFRVVQRRLEVLGDQLRHRAAQRCAAR